jgi:hypothetical protein
MTPVQVLRSRTLKPYSNYALQRTKAPLPMPFSRKMPQHYHGKTAVFIF